MLFVGINFPGHFMVSLAGRLFDPFIMQPIDGDRAALWTALGAMGMAKRELEKAIALAPNATTRAHFEKLLLGLNSSGPTMH